jgi:hypothetical protein
LLARNVAREHHITGFINDKTPWQLEGCENVVIKDVLCSVTGGHVLWCYFCHGILTHRHGGVPEGDELPWRDVR